MAQVPTGSTFYIASAIAAAKTVSSATNASESVIDSSELGNVSQKVDEAEINYRKNVARRVQEEAQKSVQNLREVLRSIQRDRQEENKLKEIAENQKVQQQLSSLENQINNS